MDSKEAKIVLQAYRPGMSANDDPRIAEALESTKRDPALAAWFEEQCAWHEALKAKFQEVPVPADLKERILAGRKVARPAAWWRSRAALVAAAALALLLVAAALVFRTGTSSDLRAYRRDMVQFVADLYQMNVRVNTWDELRQAFAKQGWPSDYAAPDALRSVRLEGGCRLFWREEKVSLLCLKTAEDKGLWLFVMNRAALPASSLTQSPQFAKVGKLSTATWSSGDKSYLLATNGDEGDLKKHL